MNNNNQFEKLLLEAWERCTDDKTLRESPTYKCVRHTLAKLTRSGQRNNEKLCKLKSLINALRAGNEVHCPKEKVDIEETFYTKELSEIFELSCPEERPPNKARLQYEHSNNDKICELALSKDTDKSKQIIYHQLPVQDTDADCILKSALMIAEDDVSMQQFFRDVAVNTCDRGDLLMRVSSDVLTDFRFFVDSVFSNRVTQISMVLAREHLSIRDRYAELESRTLNRAQLSVFHVKEVMPTFDWQRYSSEPSYIKSVVVSGCLNNARMEDVDGEDARGKGLLYQLNWLRSENDRADGENHCLHDRHAKLTAELSIINGNISSVQCRAANDIACLTDQLEKLRSRSCEQLEIIDQLMEDIQISIQNTKKEAKVAVTTRRCI